MRVQLKINLRYARYILMALAFGLILAILCNAVKALNAPVPFCKIVDGREINDHRCIPYCPPDPRECD